jgi:hypothetical protein
MVHWYLKILHFFVPNPVAVPFGSRKSEQLDGWDRRFESH